VGGMRPRVYGFGEAYFRRYVAPLSHTEMDALYREGCPGSHLLRAPFRGRTRNRKAELRALFDSMGED